MPHKIIAPAKLTLSLRITGVRPDGYHLLDAEMTSLDFADQLVIEETQSESSLKIVQVHPAGAAADDSEDGGAEVPADSSNLILRALEQVNRTANITLYKSIPPGAGLGGGSANAAAVLRWAQMLDLEAAARLGADVPFCLTGGRALVKGIGEQISPLPQVSEAFTLLVPPFGCDTAAVYALWDDMDSPKGEWGNDLEPAALALEPRLADYRDRLEDASKIRPRLAGSGSTWFVPGEFPGEDRHVVRTTPAN